MANEAPVDVSASRLANLAAAAVVEAYDGYVLTFTAITRRARDRFERREWKAAMADATERLDLYGWVIGDLEKRVRGALGLRVEDRDVWTGMKAVFSLLVDGRPDSELAETFFNSLTRRIFATVGVAENIEFVSTDAPPPADAAPGVLYREYLDPPSVEALVARMLDDCGFTARFEDRERDVRLAAERIREALVQLGLPPRVERAEVARAVFYRRKGAYVIGRLFTAGRALPAALALVHREGGIAVDAVLADEDDVSILFSFTRSHFHVDLGPPAQLVAYLKQLLPRKPVAELYIALGHHKHGKTEMYRDLLRHVRGSEERFVIAPGTPGMVMIVFTMPGYDVVLKVIRDHFPPIKPITPGNVRDTYRLVFRHDRAGRLVEAQEFEHLAFDRARFDDELVAEFRRDADRTVDVGENEVVVHHAYIERRVTPLDIHLRDASRDEAEAAVIDFGQAVKDLAANDIFPGELLPKNFGLTRHSRVACYDYDELGLLTDFTFREIPADRVDEDDWGDEAWFGVGPRDVFPEELPRFLTLSPEHRAILDRAHPELYTVAFWRDVQQRVRGGEIIDIFPYRPACRLHS